LTDIDAGLLSWRAGGQSLLLVTAMVKNSSHRVIGSRAPIEPQISLV
jgi:hypothetical protein